MEQINKPAISVITITRNRARLLPRAIKSVLNQSFKNLEYIIIDGASTDDTSTVVKDFANKDHRIHYICQTENINVVESINQAFDVSSGDYIAFLDDDDEYLPEKLEKQIDLIKTLSEEYGFVYCWTKVYDDKTGEVVSENKSTDRGNAIMEVIEKPTLGGTPTFLFKREAFKKVGGWSTKIKMPSDWEMRARAAELYYVDFVPEFLVKVHINHEYDRQSEQIINNSKQSVLNLIEFHEHFLNIFKKHFDNSPQKQMIHLLAIVKLNMMIGNITNALKYSFRIVRIDFQKIPKTTKMMLSGFIRFIRS